MATLQSEHDYRSQFLVDRYHERESDTWESLHDAAERTSRLVQNLARTLVDETDRIGDDELTALYRMCQHSETVPVHQKRKQIEGLGLPTETVNELVDMLDETVGSVGGRTQVLHVGDQDGEYPEVESTLHDQLQVLVDEEPDEQDYLNAARVITELEYHRVQSGRMSPILHYLAPELFPVINEQSRKGMQQYFGHDIDVALENYLEEREKYQDVRDTYRFHTHFRDLDWFFVWADDDDTIWTRAIRDNIDRSVWQIQPGKVNYGFPEVLWPIWRARDIVSVGWDIGPFDDLNDDLGTQTNIFANQMSGGDIVVAKHGHYGLLGLGVVQPNGYRSVAGTDEEIYIEGDGKEDTHPTLRSVDWVFTVDVDERIDTSDWNMASRFVNKTVLGYECYNELRYKLVNQYDERTLEELETLEQRSTRLAGVTDNSSAEEGGSMNEESSTEDQTNTKDPVDDEITTEKAPYYWVSHNWEEIKEEYLRAPRTDFPNYDLQKLEVGDIVFNYVDGAVIGYSEVTHPAYAVTDDGEEKRRVEIDVTRFPEPLPFAEIFPYLWREDVRLEDYYPVNKAGMNQQYLFNLSEKAGEYLLEQGGAEGTNTARLQDRLALDKVTVDLPDGLFFYGGEATRLRQQINAALNAGKHIIFTGPPGTGKTKIAKAVAEQVATTDAVDDYTFTTATAEWSSFDTVGGYVPSQSDRELEFDPRLVLQCFRDDDEQVQNQWLVIDELNRANIDKALGPLFSVLSEDSVELPYERDNRIRLDWVESEGDDELAAIATDRDRFPVTPAWRVLGTMNTFDKTSLYDLSFAFMRRFSFIHVGVPSLTTDEGVVTRKLLDPDAGPNYATVWQRAYHDLQDTIDEYHEDLAVVWAIVNEYRSIGPAIILDMLRQLDAFRGGDRNAALTSTVINYVFPQLEGLRQSKQEGLLDALVDGKRIATPEGDVTNVNLRLDHSQLRQKANDMFDLELPVKPEDAE